MRTKGVLVAAAVACFACSDIAEAGLLGLELNDFPDIVAGFIDVTFDSSTDAFLASGFATGFDDDGSMPAETILDGSFELMAEIDDFGVAQSGSLSIGGDVLGFGPDLLTADLVDFGFVSGGGELLEFALTVTGGDLADSYGGVGAAIGVILDINSSPGYSGDWTQSFDNLIGGQSGTGAGVANTATLVPAPGVLAAWGLLAIGRRRRRD